MRDLPKTAAEALEYAAALHAESSERHSAARDHENAMMDNAWAYTFRALAASLPADPDALPKGWTEALRYLHLSTAPDGQWADQAVHSFVGTMLVAAPKPNNEEGK